MIKPSNCFENIMVFIETEDGLPLYKRFDKNTPVFKIIEWAKENNIEDRIFIILDKFVLCDLIYH